MHRLVERKNNLQILHQHMQNNVCITTRIHNVNDEQNLATIKKLIDNNRYVEAYDLCLSIIADNPLCEYDFYHNLLLCAYFQHNTMEIIKITKYLLNAQQLHDPTYLIHIMLHFCYTKHKAMEALNICNQFYEQPQCRNTIMPIRVQLAKIACLIHTHQYERADKMLSTIEAQYKDIDVVRFLDTAHKARYVEISESQAVKTAKSSDKALSSAQHEDIEQCYIQRAKYFVAKEQISTAFEYLNAYMHTHGGRRITLYYLQLSRRYRHEPDLIKEKYQNLYEKYPTHLSIHIDYILYLLEQTQYTEARAECDKFIINNKNNLSIFKFKKLTLLKLRAIASDQSYSQTNEARALSFEIISNLLEDFSDDIAIFHLAIYYAKLYENTEYLQRLESYADNYLNLDRTELATNYNTVTERHLLLNLLRNNIPESVKIGVPIHTYITLPESIQRIFQILNDNPNLKKSQIFFVGSGVHALIDNTFQEKCQSLDLNFIISVNTDSICTKDLLRPYFSQHEHMPMYYTLDQQQYAGMPVDVRIVVVKNHQQMLLEHESIMRDFTICTIFCDANGKLHDPIGKSIEHFCNKILATVDADPMRTLAEDPIRVLRAIKYLSQNYTPTFALQQALHLWQPSTTDFSIIFVYALFKMLTSPCKNIVITHLRNYNLVNKILGANVFLVEDLGAEKDCARLLKYCLQRMYPSTDSVEQIKALQQQTEVEISQLIDRNQVLQATLPVLTEHLHQAVQTNTLLWEISQQQAALQQELKQENELREEIASLHIKAAELCQYEHQERLVNYNNKCGQLDSAYCVMHAKTIQEESIAFNYSKDVDNAQKELDNINIAIKHTNKQYETLVAMCNEFSEKLSLIQASEPLEYVPYYWSDSRKIDDSTIAALYQIIDFSPLRVLFAYRLGLAKYNAREYIEATNYFYEAIEFDSYPPFTYLSTGDMSMLHTLKDESHNLIQQYNNIREDLLAHLPSDYQNTDENVLLKHAEKNMERAKNRRIDAAQKKTSLQTALLFCNRVLEVSKEKNKGKMTIFCMKARRYSLNILRQFDNYLSFILYQRITLGLIKVLLDAMDNDAELRIQVQITMKQEAMKFIDELGKFQQETDALCNEYTQAIFKENGSINIQNSILALILTPHPANKRNECKEKNTEHYQRLKKYILKLPMPPITRAWILAREVYALYVHESPAFDCALANLWQEALTLEPHFKEVFLNMESSNNQQVSQHMLFKQTVVNPEDQIVTTSHTRNY